MEYVNLGKRIRAARKARKWTQGMLAQQIGRSVSYLGHVERGTRIASIETLVMLCDVLKLSADEVLGRSGFEDRLMMLAADIEVLNGTLEAAKEVANRIHAHLNF